MLNMLEHIFAGIGLMATVGFILIMIRDSIRG